MVDDRSKKTEDKDTLHEDKYDVNGEMREETCVEPKNKKVLSKKEKGEKKKMYVGMRSHRKDVILWNAFQCTRYSWC